jgi:hypothetical protein
MKFIEKKRKLFQSDEVQTKYYRQFIFLMIDDFNFVPNEMTFLAEQTTKIKINPHFNTDSFKLLFGSISPF